MKCWRSKFEISLLCWCWVSVSTSNSGCLLSRPGCIELNGDTVFKAVRVPDLILGSMILGLKVHSYCAFSNSTSSAVLSRFLRRARLPLMYNWLYFAFGSCFTMGFNWAEFLEARRGELRESPPFRDLAVLSLRSEHKVGLKVHCSFSALSLFFCSYLTQSFVSLFPVKSRSSRVKEGTDIMVLKIWLFFSGEMAFYWRLLDFSASLADFSLTTGLKEKGWILSRASFFWVSRSCSWSSLF